MRRPSALTLAWLSPIVVLLANAALFPIAQPVATDVLATHVREAKIQSTSLQTVSYAILAAGILGTCAALLLAPRGSRLWRRASHRVALVVATLLSSAVVLLWWTAPWYVAGFLGTLLVVSTFANFPPARRALLPGGGPRRAVAVLLTALVALYLLAFFVLPLTRLSGETLSANLAFTDSHYAVTILPGYDLLCCVQIGTIEHVGYGWGMPVLSAVVLKVLDVVGRGMEDLLVVVRVYQAVALGLVLIAVRLQVRRHFLWLAAVMILTTPYLALSADGRPNLVGIRYVPFLIGVIALILVARGRRLSWEPLLAALVSAGALLASPEAGLAVFSGFGAFVVFSGYRPDSRLRSVVGRLVAFLVTTVVVVLIGSTLAEHLVASSARRGAFANVALFASGNGGVVTPWVPLAALVVLFASLAAFWAAIRARQGRATRFDALQGALGVVTLTWMTYYVNRPLDSNLWFEFVLLILMWAPRLTALDLRVLSSRVGSVAPYAWLACALIGGMLVSSVSATAVALGGVGLSQTRCESPSLYIQGRCFDSPDAAVVEAHLDFLDELAPKGDYLVLSYLPTEVRLRGFNEGFPWYDPFFDVPRRSDQDAVVNWIEREGPKYLLAEDPASVQSRQLSDRSVSQQEIVRRLPSYSLVETNSGWMTYARR